MRDYDFVIVNYLEKYIVIVLFILVFYRNFNSYVEIFYVD